MRTVMEGIVGLVLFGLALVVLGCLALAGWTADGTRE